MDARCLGAIQSVAIHGVRARVLFICEKLGFRHKVFY